MQISYPTILLLLLGTVTCTSRQTPRSSLDYRASKKTCTISPSTTGADDAPAVLKAFSECRTDGHIIFQDATYHINTIMNTTGLKNVDIDIHGTILWSKDTSYWLKNSMPIGYQNQSTVWFLGGDNVHVNGFGTGTFDGNGQTWYDLVKGKSNYPNRPMGLTLHGMKDSVFEGVRFVQSQMWTMTVMHSKNVLLRDIYVNSSSTSKSPATNTDGADTLYSDNIHFDRWTVINGDDSISTKANSTNILITNGDFYNGLGVAIGSIGQYPGVFETIQNVTARNCKFTRTLHAAYLKTWTGNQVNYPPNGGGGGLGFARNFTFANFSVKALRGSAFAIDQCTSFSGAKGNCNSSKFALSDISISNVTGTLNQNPIVIYQCSAAAPCRHISMVDSSYKLMSGSVASGYQCSNVQEIQGFKCTSGT